MRPRPTHFSQCKSESKKTRIVFGRDLNKKTTRRSPFFFFPFAWVCAHLSQRQMFRLQQWNNFALHSSFSLSNFHRPSIIIRAKGRAEKKICTFYFVMRVNECTILVSLRWGRFPAYIQITTTISFALHILPLHIEFYIRLQCSACKCIKFIS